MRKLLFLFSLFCLTNYSYSQLSTITINQKKVTEIKVKTIQYDSLSNIGFLKNSKEYFKFIGQKILFYPRSENSDLNINHYGNFFIKSTLPDTVWLKKRKNPKPKDYTLEYPLSDKYKPVMINQQLVCGGNLSMLKNNKSLTGYFTPANEIEEKTFKIVDIQIQNKYESSDKYYRLNFILLSENNDTLIWKMDNFYSDTDMFPAVIEGYYKKIKELYVG
ncbi:MAG TPA: hypothetical protein VJ602_10285, partial [Paludibacter sp.]|nr:hypothetical protein [Paludibacter sp.]